MGRKRLTNEAIIAALIDKGSIKEAAQVLGCTARTLYDRMKAEEFKTLYAQAKADLISGATAKLQNKLASAIDCVYEIMINPETAAQTRVNCASTILTFAARFTEGTDIIERLERIEEVQEHTKL